jgi:hypothetical protein
MVHRKTHEFYRIGERERERERERESRERYSVSAFDFSKEN